MTGARRHICLAILLGLLTGHVGIAAHASTHAAGDVGNCHFCLYHGHASEAPPSVPDHRVPSLHEDHPLTSDREASVAPGVRAFQQRGPPRFD